MPEYCLSRYRADIAYNAHVVESEALRYISDRGTHQYYTDNFHAIQAFNGLYSDYAIQELRETKSIYEAAKPFEYAAIAGNWQLLEEMFRNSDHEIFFECHFHLLDDREHFDMLRRINVEKLLRDGNEDGALVAKIYELEIANKAKTARYLESFLDDKSELNSPEVIESFEKNKYNMVPIEYGAYSMVSNLSIDEIVSLAITHRPLTMDAAKMYAQFVKMGYDHELLELIAEGVGTKGLMEACKSADLSIDVRRLIHVLGPAALIEGSYQD